MNYYCEYYSIFIQSLRDSLLEHAGKINADTQPVIVTQVQSATKNKCGHCSINCVLSETSIKVGNTCSCEMKYLAKF